ncbi:D-alanine--D-alanine ligase B [bacterium BMS3Bbin09]|nr:D-alanine--D-alanine ligase B [bacterium BMS3Bbin09]
MGGISSEREISMRSGLAIYQNLMELGYDAVAVDVGKDIANVLKKDKVKIAFMALHGGTGENGAVQGLLEVMGIPYTGSGVLASALAMDKEASKKIFSYHGLPMAPSIIVVKKKGKKSKSAENLPDATGAYMFPGFPVPPFGPPWVVKPSSEGSSIGVEIIKEESGLEPCLGKAFSFDNRVIIEQFIKGRELHIAVLGNRVLGGVEVRPSLEFYNYEAKYTSGLTDYILPPEIEEEVYENVKEMALKAHLVLGCSGASRVDFILDGNNSPYVLEVNTLPGMTTTSLLPKIARSGGMSFNDLIEEMIKLAL